jgi:pilus assembly protein TadC
MKMDEDRSLKSMFVAFGVGLIGCLITTIGLDLLIRHLGLTWRGNIFGNNRFNWKDAAFVFLCFAGFAAGLIPTKLYFDNRYRKRKSEEEKRDN